jgi:hypothetical protein
MSRSSGERLATGPEPGTGRAQVEPLAALAAVFAVTIGFGIYTGALGAAMPAPDETAPTRSALDAVAGAASDDTGVVTPDRLGTALDAAPGEHRVNATLTTAERRWTAGPPTPASSADRATRRVAVATTPDRTRVGRLRVVLW